MHIPLIRYHFYITGMLAIFIHKLTFRHSTGYLEFLGIKMKFFHLISADRNVRLDFRRLYSWEKNHDVLNSIRILQVILLQEAYHDAIKSNRLDSFPY